VKTYDLKSNLGVLAPLPTGMMPGGQIKGALRAILFDIYGTLFVSGSGDVGISTERFRPSDALTALREHYRIPWSSTQMSQKLFAAIRDQHQRAKSAGVTCPEIEIDRIWQKILNWPDMHRVREMAAAYESIVNPTYPMPGLDQTLRTLRRRRITMGIISNAQFFTPGLFKTFLGSAPQDLGFARDLIFYSFEFGQAKPALDIFRRAVDQLRRRKIPPESVLYVGNDIRNDIQPAHTVGLQTALFAGDRRSLRLRQDDPACRAATPDLIVTDLRQLLDLDLRADGEHA
jgi:putative hydrolase of the HAD superfamily